ncbi:FG-GAP-like repeat-containing protein [Streptomyces cocklensis]|uniref:Repeat domain-containing protein n=1 Tax=Actinacidiphila cocklensis TaxID=887465 RepID=A0A9W4EBC9_9ACTN|nr:FG-GAP-like repeat-containing protein [Actinacidiphila cocklensis]MDD1057831.1 FG-GAP-like repeat-containing protein [Actinacidiphila cocklensis]CAG6398566.1 Repeat domain-containing protein [Actinacidiphila cocklensis]
MRLSFRGICATLALTVGLAAGSVLPAASSAAASTDPVSRCPSGRLCLFDGLDGTGSMTSYSGSMTSLGSWANRARSFVDKAPYVNFCPSTEPGPAATNEGYSGDPTVLDFRKWDAVLDRNVESFVLTNSERECETGVEYPSWLGDDAAVTRPRKLFGDLNRDGRTDLLYRSPAGRLYFLRGDESGTLIGGGWNSMTAITRHGDLNSDGGEDLLARDTSGVLWLYPGKGNGQFGARTKVGTGWNSMRRIASAGDLTGDGRPDLLAADTAGTLWLYPGDGKGRLGNRSRVGGGWNSMTALVGAGAFDGDSLNDLVARDTTGRLWFYPGNGHGGFAPRVLIGTGGWQEFTTVLGLGDASGDGVNDLYAISSDAISFYKGRGDGRIYLQGANVGWEKGDMVF